MISKSELIDYFIRYRQNPAITEELGFKVESEQLINRLRLEKELFQNIGYSGSAYKIDNKRFNIFHISVKKNDDLNVVKEEIELLLSRIEYHWPGLNDMMFEIYEYTCANVGIYSLDYFKPNTWVLNNTNWGRKSEVNRFDNLMECLQYLQQNHYWVD